MARIRLLILITTIIFLFLIQVLAVKAAVDLIDFSTRVVNNVIIINWETASELDNSGFYVQKSTDSGSGYTRISDFIQTEAEGPTGATYAFTDTEVVLGPIYFYKLEQVDRNGNPTFTGPISASLNPNTPTATRTSTVAPSTATKTATLTATRTSTSLPNFTATPTKSPTHNPTATKTALITPSKTPIVYPPTPTVRKSTATSTLLPGDITITATYTQTTPTVTPTLIPLPQVTLLFPVEPTQRQITSTPTRTPTSTQPSSAMQKTIINILPPRWRLLGGAIILVWILLGLFLVVYTKRLTRL